MLTISVRDFRGCERADLQVSPIALVSGLNGSGKSSILRAAGAALSGRPLPAGTHKKDADVLVRSGASGGSVTVSVDGGSCRTSWPAADPSMDGDAPRASVFATGIDSVLWLDDRERARVLAQYMKADPNRDDLAAALHDADVSEEQIGKAWELVERHGWDGAAEKAKTDGAAAKREWERLTGEKYGSAKAGAWAPTGWTSDLSGLSAEALQQQIEAAKTNHEKAVRAEAVGAERLAQLAEQAGRLDSLKKQLRDAQTGAAQAKTAEDEARAALNALPPVPDHESVSRCPCCDASLAVKVVGAGKYRLDQVEAVNDAEKAARQQAITTAQAALAEATSLSNRLANDVRSLDAFVLQAEQSKAEHDKLTKEAGAIGAAGSVDEAKAELFRAEGRYKAAKIKASADALHVEIGIQMAVVKALAPEGVRKRKLSNAVESFNGGILEPLCDAAGWKAVTLTEDLAAQFGGRPYPLLSDSEQYRVRVTLQLAMARLDGSSMVIIDGAEILDPAGRNGLFGLLGETGLPALVGMTVAAADKAPDLSAHDLGATYWVEKGTCRPVGTAAKKEAA